MCSIHLLGLVAWYLRLNHGWTVDERWWWILRHALSLELLILLKQHLVVHLLSLGLIYIDHDLICLIHTLIHNHLFWIYWLINHHWLRHWLWAIVGIVHEMSVLHCIVTISTTNELVVTSISSRKFRLLWALGYLMIHWCAFHQVALATLGFIATVCSATSCSVMLGRTLSLAGSNLWIFRLFWNLMVWIHITTLSWMKLVLLRISLLVVLCDNLPLEPSFRSFVFLKTYQCVCFAKSWNSLVGHLLTILLILVFFLVNFLMISFHKVVSHVRYESFARVLLSTKQSLLMLSTSNGCTPALIWNIGHTWSSTYMGIFSMTSWPLCEWLSIVRRHSELVSDILATFVNFWSD